MPRSSGLPAASKPLTPQPYTLAKRDGIYHNACVKVDKFCVQLTDNLRNRQGINRHLYPARFSGLEGYVGKGRGNALMSPTIAHTRVPRFLYKITDTLRHLSTLSTPPITTTTNIFK
jgi:hypothetical protein